MSKHRPIFLVMALLVAFSLVFTLAGCGGSEENVQKPVTDNSPPVAEQPKGETPDSAKAIEAANSYLSSERGKTPTMNAKDVYDKVILSGDAGYLLVSLQKPEDYAKGHVKGAINIPYAQVAKKESLDKLSKDKKIVVICYTGHTASYTAMFLNQLGYEAYAMKFGMMGWNAGSAGMGTVKPFDKSPGYPVETDVIEAEANNDLPAFPAGGAEEVIVAAADNYLSSERGKTPTVNAQDIYEKVVQDGDTGYFLVSLQKPEDYAKGHVKGAINIPYSQIAKEENLKKLPEDKKIVLICYTGHTAGYASMLLNQLGYEAYTMKFGMMGWNAASEGMGTVTAFDKSPDYPVVEGANP